MTAATRFQHRLQAGELLAKRLRDYAQQPGVIVLAIPRGGVPVGFTLARALDVPLDVLLVRKLGVPGFEEFAMGAVASGGLCVLKLEVADMFDIAAPVIEALAQRELAELQRREKLYRAGRRALALAGRSVILVDDGLATGATMLAAIKSVRRQHPEQIIVAVPVAAPDSCQALRTVADQVICLSMPEPFHAVGLWYRDFPQVDDEEVQSLLARAEQWPLVRSVRADDTHNHPQHARHNGA